MSATARFLSEKNLGRFENNRTVKKLQKNVVSYIQDYCQHTTLHGFNHLVMPKRHWLEWLFWAAIIAGATGCAARLIYRSWSRYQRDPTVVSIDKEYRKWNTTFPATTLCFRSKFNETKAVYLIKKKWNVQSGSKFEYYMKFLQTVANSSYYNLHHFKEFSKDIELNSANLAELLEEINFDFENYKLLVFPQIGRMEFHKTLTEMGICYSYNSFTTPYLRPGGKKPQISETPKTTPTSPQCNVLNSLCYGRLDNAERAVNYYVHSRYELPDSTSKYWSTDIGQESDTAFNYLTITAQPSLRALTKQQRKCSFRDEAQMPYCPYYSFKLCKMDCRRELSMKLCNCVPHFYVKRDDQPYCDVKGLVCLSKHSGYLVELISEKGKKYLCPCYASCSDTEYFLDKQRLHMWSYPKQTKARYRWAIETFTKTMLKRDILYGVEDLLVSLGGTAGLFLGCSLLSGVELVYFFTLRMLRCICRSVKKSKNHPQRSTLFDREISPTNFEKRRSRILQDP